MAGNRRIAMEATNFWVSISQSHFTAETGRAPAVDYATLSPLRTRIAQCDARIAGPADLKDRITCLMLEFCADRARKRALGRSSCS